MLTPGKLTDPVRIEKRIETPDGQGGKVVTYETRADIVWAATRPLNGREALLQTQVTATLSSVWEILFRSDISVKDRIVSGSRIVEIESYYDPGRGRERGRELHLICSEVQA